MTILLGDCREILPTLDAGSVRCCVTSPPYWGLRDYGMDGQIGLEKTPEAYVAELVTVFREVRRVLADDGTLWLNIGDSYANDTKWGGQTSGKHAASLHGKTPLIRAQKTSGLKAKDLVGIPWRVAFALQADGWYLRSDIIWHKPNPMPESVTDRPTKSHEYVFLLSKSARYFYDAGAISEAVKVGDRGSSFTDARDLALHPNTSQTRGKWSGEPAQSSGKRIVENVKRARAAGAPHDSPFGNTRNARTVWTIPTQPTPDAHFATFPEALAERCILTGSAEGDVVLDPFFGSGTVGKVAERLGRKWIGIELNPAYVEIGKKKTAQRGLYQ